MKTNFFNSIKREDWTTKEGIKMKMLGMITT